MFLIIKLNLLGANDKSYLLQISQYSVSNQLLATKAHTKRTIINTDNFMLFMKQCSPDHNMHKKRYFM